MHSVFFTQVIHLCKTWLFYFNQFMMLHNFNIFNSQNILISQSNALFLTRRAKYSLKQLNCLQTVIPASSDFRRGRKSIAKEMPFDYYCIYCISDRSRVFRSDGSVKQSKLRSTAWAIKSSSSCRPGSAARGSLWRTLCQLQLLTDATDVHSRLPKTF